VKEYVAGLLFSTNRQQLALIHKGRGPVALIGKWNVPGGKIDPDELPYDAMKREFKEETGVEIQTWSCFLTLDGDGWRVYFFVAFSDKVITVKTMEDETVGLGDVSSILSGFDYVLVPNLHWIIPMSLTCKESTVSGYQVQEVVAP
jgi:8-oxo-dGTP pyrophosphatase MutT (NUDIX family)